MLIAAGDASAAAGTNIAISAAAAATGGYRHAREGRVDWRVVAWMAPPSIAGAVLGALAGHLVPTRALFAASPPCLRGTASTCSWRRFEPDLDEQPRLVSSAMFGFVIGLVGGALGVILGTLRMPALLRAVGLDARRAVGTNLIVGFLLGLAAFVAYAFRLEVDWDLFAVGLAGALPGAWFGARADGPDLRAGVA